MKKIKMIWLLCLTAAVMVSCTDGKTSPEHQTIFYSISSEPVTLDPQIADDNASRLVIMNIFEGLVRIDGNEAPVCGAADRWESNAQNTEYVFHIRENACWQDGSPLTAQDFLYGFQRAFLPATASPTADTLFCIKNARQIQEGTLEMSALGVRAEDEHTLRITLDFPEPQFLSLLATPPAMPCKKAFFETTGGQYGREDDRILSNGAFVVAENGWKHDRVIRLQKNTAYVGQHLPVPQGVHITIADLPDSAADAILSHQLDCSSLESRELSEAQAHGFHLTAYKDTVWGIAFNVQVFRNAAVRLALLHALDRKEIVSNLPESCEAFADIVPDTARCGGLAYRSFVGSELGVAFSDNAREEWQKALASMDTEESPALNILCTDEAEIRPVVNNIICAWNKITGRVVNKTPVPREELHQKIADGDYGIVIAPLRSDSEDPADLLRVFSSGSPDNMAHLSDTTYDSLLDQIEKLHGTSAINTMVKAEKYLHEHGIFYPLYTENRYYASAPEVTGIIFHPYGAEADFSLARKQKS